MHDRPYTTQPKPSLCSHQQQLWWIYSWPYSTRLSLSKMRQHPQEGNKNHGLRIRCWQDLPLLRVDRMVHLWPTLGHMGTRIWKSCFPFRFMKHILHMTIIRWCSMCPMSPFMATSFHETRNRKIKFARHIALTWSVSNNGSNCNNALCIIINVVPCTSISSCSPHPFLPSLSLSMAKLCGSVAVS